jgi:hypothetical protein
VYDIDPGTLCKSKLLVQLKKEEDKNDAEARGLQPHCQTFFFSYQSYLSNVILIISGVRLNSKKII